MAYFQKQFKNCMNVLIYMTERTNITVIGMGYVGIPMAALLADVDDFYVTGIQRRSQRSGW